MTASEQKLKQRYIDAKERPSCRNCVWMKEFYSDRLEPMKSVFCFKGNFRLPSWCFHRI